MDGQLHLFREQVLTARRRAGYFQKDLAAALGLDSGTLSRKLHGTAQMTLTHTEVKLIIKVLATWEAITTQEEALRLLTAMGLNLETFSAEEWQNPPFKQLASLPPSSFPASSDVSTVSAHVPRPLTSFIGREEEVQEICDLLTSPDVRLVTLLGTGGVGKTRLSIAVAHHLTRTFPDGIFFLSLATIQDALLVPAKITEMLQLHGLVSYEEGVAPSPFRVLATYLQEKRALLVLDNFEHLLPAVAFLGELLTVAPTIKLLLTSRVALHLYGEYEWAVRPFSVTDIVQTQDLEALSLHPAMRLFLARASAVKRNLRLTEKNRAAIAHICHFLDGIPLAIELAAARCKFLSPHMILRQLLGDSWEAYHPASPKRRPALEVLQQEAVNIPVRHWTVRQTLDWSYALLDTGTQRLFLQLGLFLGGWTLSALQAICRSEEETDGPQDCASRLEQLVNHSLVEQAESDEEEAVPRFHLLEIVREYTLERLSESGKSVELFQRHAQYYLDLVERIEPELSSPQRGRAMFLLAREAGNLHAAIRWSIEQENTSVVYRFYGALGTFWGISSQFAEAHTWLEKALVMNNASVPPLQKAKVFLAAAYLAECQGAWEQTRTFAKQALALYEAHHDLRGKGDTLYHIGISWSMQGELARAIASFEKSLAIFEELQDWLLCAWTLNQLGTIDLSRGAFVTAHHHLVKAVELARRSEDQWGVSMALTSLAFHSLLQRQDEQALHYLHEALSSYGSAAIESTNMVLLLLCFGYALGNLGYMEQAALLGSATEAFFVSLGTALPSIYQPFYERSLNEFRSQVEPDLWETWWVRGKKLTQEEAVALAFQCSERVLQKNGRVGSSTR